MIQLSPRNLLVYDQDGGASTLDTELQRQRLHAAFAECAIGEEWIADNLLQVLEEKVRLCNESGVRLTHQDVQRILINVLSNSGFPDVSRVFARISSAAPPESPEELALQLRHWSPAELAALLQGSFRLNQQELEYLQQRLPEVLNALAFSGESATLVIELARHLLHFFSHANPPQEESPEPAEETPPVSPLSIRTKYIAASQWHLSLPDSVQQLIDNRIVRLMPVSDIMPIAVVECSLPRIYDLPGAPQFELELFARLQVVCQGVEAIVGAMLAQVNQEWPTVEATTAHIRFAAFQNFVKLGAGTTKKSQLKAFESKMRQLLEGALPSDNRRKLSISFC